MTKQTGAKLLVEALKAQGVRHIFGIPGIHILPVYDLLYDELDIKPIVVRHEQAAAFAADGYAKVSGKPAVCLTVPGPGATNMVTAVAAAFQDSVPMVVMTPQVPRDQLGRGATHDCDLVGVFRPVVKGCVEVDRVEDIPDCVHRAFRMATEGRPAPVQVLLPATLLAGSVEAPLPCSEVPSLVERTEPSLKAELREAAALLEQAQAPVIYAGVGVILADAAVELRRLAEKLSAPVLTSMSARGVIPETHPLCGGLLSFEGSADLLAQADACLAVGTRFADLSTLSWTAKFPANLIHVNIDPSGIGKTYPARVPIVGEAKHALRALEELVGDRPGATSSIKAIEQLKAQHAATMADFFSTAPAYPIHPLWLTKLLRDCLPEDTVFAVDSTSAEFWLSEQVFTITKPRTVLLNAVYQSMGYSLPAALGAKLASPTTNVVCVVGDGAFMMHLGELATAVAYDIAVPIVVFNDGYYNVLRQMQKHIYDERYIGVRLNNPDFVKLAESFGAVGHRIDKPEDLPEVIRSATRERGPVVIDVPVDIDALPRRLQQRLEERRAFLKPA